MGVGWVSWVSVGCWLGELVKTVRDSGNARKFALRAPCAPTSPLKAGAPARRHRGLALDGSCTAFSRIFCICLDSACPVSGLFRISRIPDFRIYPDIAHFCIRWCPDFPGLFRIWPGFEFQDISGFVRIFPDPDKRQSLAVGK